MHRFRTGRQKWLLILMWWGSWSKEVKIRDFAHALEDITTSFYTLEAPSRLWKTSWQKPCVTNYGKLGAESSSCKTQLTRQPFLPTRELSGQAQLPSTCSRPHATFWKCLSAYQQAKVTPDNICFISPCKTLNTKWKVSTNCIDTENIALLTERPRTPEHKPRPNRTRLRSSLRRRDSPPIIYWPNLVLGCRWWPSPVPWTLLRSRGAVPELMPCSVTASPRLARLQLAPAWAEPTCSCLHSSVLAQGMRPQLNTGRARAGRV